MLWAGLRNPEECEPRRVCPGVRKQSQDSFVGGAQTGFLANGVRACVPFSPFSPFFSRILSMLFVDRVFIRHFRHLRQTPGSWKGQKPSFAKDPVCVLPNVRLYSEDTLDHDTEICNFGKVSPLDFFGGISSSGYFYCFSRFSVQFSKEIAPKCGENCPISGRRRKKRRILSRLWLSCFFFFSSDIQYCFWTPRCTHFGLQGQQCPKLLSHQMMSVSL